jgi:glycosyltransferase involved in cell wall biosynthesis
MRILHVIPSVSSQRGGPSFAVRMMAETIARHHVEVHIVATDDDGIGRATVPLEEALVENSVTYRYFQRQTTFYTFSLPLTRWLWNHVGEYDLLHIHSLFSYATLPAAWFAHWHGVPYIIRPLGHLNRWGIQNRRAALKRLSLRWIEGPILRRATLLHFTCEQERLEAAEVGVSGPTVIAPLGIDTTPFQQLPSMESFSIAHPQTQNNVRLLFLSRIDPKKGLDLLLAAFAKLRQSHPDIVLVIAGDGDAAYLAELKALAQQLDIADAVIWTGFLTGRAKLAALAAADLFVLPSYSENFGIAVVEAMAAGLPVVISDQVGIHHEVSKGNAGLVTPCQVEPLRAALWQLVTNSTQRQQLGSNGKQLVEQLFSQSAMTQHLLAMYEQVLYKPGQKQPIQQPSILRTSE